MSDQELERHYHPENFETVLKCPKCKSEDITDLDGENFQCNDCGHEWNIEEREEE